MKIIKIKMQLNKLLTFIEGERAFMHFSDCFLRLLLNSSALQKSFFDERALVMLLS